MKVGSIETIGNKKKKRKLSSELKNKLVSGGGNNKNQSSGGGSGGGGDNRPDSDHFEETEYSSDKFRMLTWFLLLVVLMTFGGLIGAYIVISTNGVIEWRAFDLPGQPLNLPIQVWISTVLLLSSSVTYFFADRSLNSKNQEKARKFYLATTVLGGMFIASQLLAWVALVQSGVYLKSNPYAGFFYVFTAIHAIHLVGGIIALGFIVLRTWHPTENAKELKKRRTFSAPIGWYWHFMDGIWIVLLILLGFWK